MKKITGWIRGTGKGRLEKSVSKGHMGNCLKETYNGIDEYIREAKKYVGENYELQISVSKTEYFLDYRRLKRVN